ncbi:uncharacterized protein SEPMUDRAFT_121732 [Sphaerulina musiva SO2202]|uniref:HAT C-terminal dimerisation domain-containing protein n=1 Tax=Sphaerulina musiva (strain SO2202) TaxID=692275 RepID=M3CUV1_SPHMS|nr:uncharacterized protein SEPMUDRAFT_121732 [Sphaerulina musiva SO2202]EMF07922.1 hypothetical protein SEPMUDRAFT_121732 [Sphaerulina musiva SO2202]
MTLGMKVTARITRLADYLDADMDEGDPFEVLKTWSSIESKYPTLALIARDILYIPAAGVGYERDFSIARHQSRFNRQYTAATFSGLMVSRFRYRDDEYDARVLIAQEATEVS